MKEYEVKMTMCSFAGYETKEYKMIGVSEDLSYAEQMAEIEEKYNQWVLEKNCGTFEIV